MGGQDLVTPSSNVCCKIDRTGHWGRSRGFFLRAKAAQAAFCYPAPCTGIINLNEHQVLICSIMVSQGDTALTVFWPRSPSCLLILGADMTFSSGQSKISAHHIWNSQLRSSPLCGTRTCSIIHKHWWHPWAKHPLYHCSKAAISYMGGMVSLQHTRSKRPPWHDSRLG